MDTDKSLELIELFQTFKTMLSTNTTFLGSVKDPEGSVSLYTFLEIQRQNPIILQYYNARDWIEIYKLTVSTPPEPDVTDCLNKLGIHFSLVSGSSVLKVTANNKEYYFTRTKEQAACRFRDDMSIIKSQVIAAFDRVFVTEGALDDFWDEQARIAFNKAFLFAMKSTYEDPDPI